MKRISAAVLIAMAAMIANGPVAHAACNLIPSAQTTFPPPRQHRPTLCRAG
jgi:hypothetical protein